MKLMEIDYINISLAFLEGLALIISPCILPILPIILSASLPSGKRHPYGIILGFVLSFALFTFFSKELVEISGINLNWIRNVSFGILIILGLIMMSNFLSDKLSLWTEGLVNLGSRLNGHREKSGFWGGILFGCLLGLIWTPCAGPILATVIVQIILQKSTISSFLTILFFALGSSIPMLIIVLFGNKIMTQFSFFQKHAILIRKILGLIIILSIFWMIYGNAFYANISMPQVTGETKEKSLGNHLQKGLKSPYKAPELKDITAWINSPPLTLEELKGKVVLIDFWAYSCINCIRTLPYLKDWHQKYHDQGFVIIGVHSPEFDFEKDYNNVNMAAKNDDIKYPIALDNQFGTWQNYHNLYWPAHYLIDKSGNVVYEHFGEGNYDTTENNIRYLLGIKTPMPTTENKETNLEKETPETYLGYERGQSFRSPEGTSKDLKRLYSFPQSLALNEWALKGNWIIEPQEIISSERNAAIKIRFYAKRVFAVMGVMGEKPIMIRILLNGKEIKNEKPILNSKLYTMVEMDHASDNILEIITSEPGLKMYTFTFGN